MIVIKDTVVVAFMWKISINEHEKHKNVVFLYSKGGTILKKIVFY